MRLKHTLLLAFLFYLNGIGIINAQTGCNYTLELFDSFGDGWNGAQLSVSVDGTSEIYLLDGVNDDGISAVFTISLTDGAALELVYTGGDFEGEVSYVLFDSEGVVVYEAGPVPPMGMVFSGTASCPTCPILEANTFEVGEVTDTSVEISWTMGTVTGSYIVEYGLQGFNAGSGSVLLSDVPNANIGGLEENTFYDVYVRFDCGGGDLSNPIGPFSFQTAFTNPPLACFYTLELFDSFGDGWNGSFLTVTHNGASTNYTIDDINDDGFSATFQVMMYDDLPLQVTYTAGAFQGEVSYNIFDSDGLVVYSDGPNPLTGVVVDGLATCPSCPALDPDSFSVDSLGANVVDVSWNPGTGSGTYIVEFGLEGFVMGSGSILLSDVPDARVDGLEENTFYDIYIQQDCGGGELSTPVGPYTIQTEFENAPATCEYIIQLNDSFGDGWNGSVLSLTHNGVTTEYTLDNVSDDGMSATFGFTAFQNLAMVFNYTAGAFQGEVSYEIIGPDGEVVFADGPNPATGEVFSLFACPTCPGPSGVTVDDVYAHSAVMSWNFPDSAGVFIIEYDTTGFTPGTGAIVTVMDTMAMITGLEEFTFYDFYISLACENGDSSGVVGPFTFQTLRLNDIGISAINTPITGCGLGVETVEVAISNFGSAPQTLIPFRYSVNGVPAGVPVPTDGFYTGVIGKDSTVVVPFETVFDFSMPGEYTIAAWTDLENDSDMSNDTFFITIINIPVIAEFPYEENFETWNGGWTVDDSSVNSSWNFGQPEGTLISSAASGTNAWVTNLSGAYNNNELSFLVSPCLDFSSIEEDPRLSFSINFNSESCCDEGWVEVSVDAGASWSKLGASGTGTNWYNDDLENWWDGDGGFSGWVSADHVLTGTAGMEEVMIRFVFSSDGSVTEEGFGVDDISIIPPVTDDLSAIGATQLSATECGLLADNVSMEIRNNGTLSQSGFDVAYQVNGGDPVVENVGAFSLASNETGTYTFSTPFDSSAPGTYTITVYTLLSSDLVPGNDTTTFTFEILSPQPLPLVADFEDGLLPQGWTSSEAFTPVGDGHNNTSFVLQENLFSGTTSYETTTARVGPVNPGDSLTFDYRYTLWSAGTDPFVLGADQLEIQISTDCENFETVFVIDSTNHSSTAEMTNVLIDLDAYAGQAIKIRFSATWESGDYWLDIDNVNIIGCPQSLDIQGELTSETTSGAGDGAITAVPTQGQGPYAYMWDNGADTSSISGLGAGMYTVSVVDAIGCMDVQTFEISVCPESLDLQTEVVDESEAGAEDGSVTVVSGAGTVPYTYLWEDGSTEATLDSLPAGTYTATVTDATGCMDVVSATIDISVSSSEIGFLQRIELAPNPTRNSTVLELGLSVPADVKVQLVSLLGNILLEKESKGVQEVHHRFDLSNQSAGMYMVRIIVEDQMHVEKILYLGR